MTCLSSWKRWARRATLTGLVSTVLAAGCGGEGSPKRPDAGTPDAMGTVSLMVDKTSLAFGTVEVGQTSTMQELTITNQGTLMSGPLAVNAMGDFRATGCGMPLAPKANCKLSVTFAPTAAGVRSGMVSISSSGSTTSTSLSGTGAMGGVGLMPDSLTFPTAVVGSPAVTLPVTVRNNGAAGSVMVNVSGDFTQTNDCMTLEAGRTCTVQVSFAPKTGGEKAGSLTVQIGNSVGTVILRGPAQDQARIAANPAMATLTATAGTQGPAVTIGVANTGDVRTGAVSVTPGGANAGDFEVIENGCAAGIAGNGTCTVRLAVKASATPGMKTGNVVIAGTPGGMATVALTANVVPQSSITINPTSGTFASTIVGQRSEAVTFTVRNAPGAAATAPLSVSTSADFLVTSNNCQGQTLAGNATCTVGVAFEPKVAGGVTGTLTVTGGASVAQASLTGAGVPTTQLAISAPSASFGSIPINSTAEQTLTITNTSPVATGTLSAALSGAGAGQFAIAGNNCTASLAPAATCTVAIRFAPTGVGSHSATLTVSGTPGGMVTSSLSGAATMGAVLAFAPPTYDFTAAAGGNPTVVGQTSANASFVVTNNGMIDTGMLVIAIEGVNKEDFAIVNNGCSTLAPGAPCTVSVRFAPGSAGQRNASVVARSTTGGQLGAAALTGTSVLPLELPTVASTDFGNVTVGRAGTAKTFTFIVRAPAPMNAAPTVAMTAGGTEFSAPAITGCTKGSAAGAAATLPADYAVNPADPTTWLWCTVSVNFEPKEPRGAKQGTLTITHGTLTLTQGFSGVGVGALQVNDVAINATVGTAQTGTFTVTNNSLTATATGVTATFTGGADLTVVTNSCVNASLAPAATCAVTVRYGATAAGTSTGTLAVAGTAAGVAETASATLTATATNAPVGITPTVSPSPADFGAVALTTSKTVTLTVANPAGGATTGMIAPIVAGTGYSLDSIGTCTGGLATLPAGGSCTFTVRYTAPANASLTSPATGTVTVLGITTNLTATPVQSLVITPGTHDFGAGVVNDLNGPETTFTLTNNGTAIAAGGVTLSFVAGAGAGADVADYTLSGTNTCANGIAANGGTCTFQVRFSPNMATGPSSAVVQAVAGGSIVAQAAVAGTQIGDADLVWVNDPTAGAAGTWAQNFGTVQVGGSSAGVTYTLQNVGGAAASITVPALSNGFAFVNEATTCWAAGATMASLAPGATCNIVVVFRPTMAINPATSTIALTALGKKLQDATASLDDLSFTAVGVAAQGAGSLYVQGAPASLGDTFPGTATAPVTLTFVNNTATPAVITGFAASSTDFVPAAGTCAAGMTVNPAGGSCTFTAAFNPAAGTFGIRSGTVTVQTDQGNIVAGVYGRVRHDAIVSITDPAGAGAFGDVVGLTTSGVRTWTITNTGERAPSALMVAVSGANAGEFNVGGTCQGATPAPGGTCTITASVTPATFGDKTATITITAASQLENSGQTIALTARGVTTALLAASAGNGGTFGATPLGTSTVTTTVTVTNRMGTTNVQSSGPLTVSLSNSTDFAVSGCADPAAAMGVSESARATPTCALTVTFQPKSVGTLTGNLTISGTPGGSVVIPLTGTATPNLAIAPSADTTIASGNTTTFNVSLNSLAMNTVSTGALSVGLGGANAASFAIVANTCTGTTLSTGGTTTCAVDVRYTGTGAAAANLTVAGSPAGNQVTVNLIGQ